MSLIHIRKRLLRRNFGKVKEVVSLPNLIEVQTNSFNELVQLDFLPSERKKIGIEKILSDIFPINYNDRISLEYVSYELGDWACICGQLSGINNRYTWKCSSCKKTGCSRLGQDHACPECGKGIASYSICKKCSSRVALKVPLSVDECRYSGKTYALPFKIRMQLITWDVPENEEIPKTVRDIKEQEVFFCDMPIMADVYEENGVYKLGSEGTFLINGIERVIVSQLHRSPGVVFTLGKKVKDARGQLYHMARIIPARGSWLDFEFDHNDLLYVRIDKKKKILVTTLLQALGFEREKILSHFYSFETISLSRGSFSRKVDENLIGTRLDADALPKNVADTFKVGRRITKEVLKQLIDAKITRLVVRKEGLFGSVLAQDVVDLVTGEVLAQQGAVLNEDILQACMGSSIRNFVIIKTAGYASQPVLALTLGQDHTLSYEDALREVYFKLRPGDVPTTKIMEEYLHNLFFNPRFYDLGRVGRIRTNRKLSISVDTATMHLTHEDLIGTIAYLIGLKERGEGELDDIDHLGNRSVRLVAELVCAQLHSAFATLDRIIRERFRLSESGTVSLMPHDYINVKPVVAVIREFFGSGQLSQFKDQTNPLAEIAHKRRLSALGQGGLTRERATFEVRDVHISHYGRICPIETPEGQNIGLISSLATYARVNDLGFIETPYRPVKNKVVSDDVVYLDAFEEADENIAQATVPLDNKNTIVADKVLIRRFGNIISEEADDVTYVDASPRQLVSVATALIPFLEHDDANRALMGSNMQRQAVPLIKCSPPLVGTGMERELGNQTGVALVARKPGVVTYVSADKIVVRLDEKDVGQAWFSKPVEIYHLKKFARSSHNTWIHHSPLVRQGDRVEKGTVLTTGPGAFNGELALGNDVLVAFMPWRGYNFEDAIVVSNRLVSDDVFTSIHVEEFVVEARDTKLGAEEITRDIPNVSEKDLEALDDDGIVRIGTRVKPRDILVGKVTLKGDVQVSPEEKLLRAIFGEKSREVRDTSLRVPPGIHATVVDVKVFSRKGIRKDKRYKEIVSKETIKIEENFSHQLVLLRDAIRERLSELLMKTAQSESEKKKIRSLSFDEILNKENVDKETAHQIKYYKEILNNQISVLNALKEERINKLRKGDDLPSGVIKMIRVSLAMKRTLSVGDKMAGRHGNKGIVSQIVNREDMPYMEDGTPVDMVLNPLGVPGRMNVGQILETMLGMASHKIGRDLQEKIKEMSYESTREYLCQYYGKDLIDFIEKDQGSDSVLELARRTADKGCFMVTPIFDGADYERDIKPLLHSLDLPVSGTYQLFDGMTGEMFDQRVTVGSIYMMKLNHLADDKLHARSVGPYSLITQQPLGGKAQFGGQRLGEMEVWALYAYGAAYALQEMLTVKSDDVTGRVKTYEAIVRGDDVPEPGIPESFNVMVKELQSLGLQIDLLKVSKEQSGE